MDLDKIIDDKINALLDKIENDYTEIVNEINDIYFEEANKVYDNYIKQFYLYRTTSYVRHWESRPGTQKGANLLYGKNFKKHKGKDPYFELYIDSTKMEDNYQHDSAFDILTDITRGANIVYGSNGFPVWERDLGAYGWTGKYNSRYFKFTGTLEEALYHLLDTYNDNLYPMFKSRWRLRGW